MSRNWRTAPCVLSEVAIHLDEEPVIGQPSDESGHCGTEEFFQFRERGFGVLDGIVQEIRSSPNRWKIRTGRTMRESG